MLRTISGATITAETPPPEQASSVGDGAQTVDSDTAHAAEAVQAADDAAQVTNGAVDAAESDAPEAGEEA
eukprot:COSAG04_NODE_14656_length_560_cov_0.941432_2_plen_70_part_00